MTAKFPHLNLRDWPFNVVPSEQSAEIWVGRPEVERRLKTLLRTIRRVEASRIVLFWAAYGAGKTHALQHLRFKAQDASDVQALYVVTPKGIKSFLDVHRAIIDSALSAGLVEELGLALLRKYGPSGGPSDLQRALVQLVGKPEAQRRHVLSWLKAEKVDKRELHSANINHKLETSADGIEALDELIGLAQRELGAKLLIMLDEIQELGELSRPRLQEAVGGLHKVFDRNTEDLTLLFSFTTGSQKTVARIIGETLYERRSDILTLPALSRDEGAEFITGLLRSWSIDRDNAPFPFTEDAVKAVVNSVAQERPELTPRDLIRAFDAILRDGDLDIEDGLISTIEADYARRRLDQLTKDDH